MTQPTSELLQDIIPPMYADVANSQAIPTGVNMAQSNLCHLLTSSLFGALDARLLTARREYHEHNPTDTWHFLIAHEPVSATPSADDLITDLNPWQFAHYPIGRTYLHGTRGEVQEILRKAEAPEWFVCLRGIETIKQAHRLILAPIRLRAEI